MKTLASLDEEVTSAFGRQVDVQVRRRGERRSGKETHIRWNHGTIVVSLPNGLEGRVSGTDVSHDAVLTPHNPAAYDKVAGYPKGSVTQSSFGQRATCTTRNMNSRKSEQPARGRRLDRWEC